jgi:SAM-dependent methyltransferase
VNREAYDRIADEWDRARTDLSALERGYVDVLLDGLSVPSAVLDLGCGTGRPIAEYVLARGHAVTGVDQAPRLLELAGKRFPNATWLESRLEDVALPPRSYAAAVCWDALFHIERAHHASIIAKVADALQPGGRFMLTVGGMDHPAFTDTMFGELFFYDSHPPEKALEILAHTGFEPVVSEFTDLPTMGRDKGRYAIVARLAHRDE